MKLGFESCSPSSVPGFMPLKSCLECFCPAWNGSGLNSPKRFGISNAQSGSEFIFLEPKRSKMDACPSQHTAVLSLAIG